MFTMEERKQDVINYAKQNSGVEEDGRVFGFYGAPLHQLTKDELIRLVKELDYELSSALDDDQDYSKAIDAVVDNFIEYTE